MADARIYYTYYGQYRHYIEYRDVSVPYITVRTINDSNYSCLLVAFDLKKVPSPQCSGCYWFRTGEVMSVQYYSDSTYKVGYYDDKTAYGSSMSNPEVDLEVNWATRFQEIRAYFDQIPKGQGVVTLTLKKPGQNLSFTSALLGKDIEQFISADTEVNFDGSTVGITLEGGKGDEVAIYEGSTLLKTVTFGTNEITATTDVPLNEAITFTSTKFKYGDDNTYFSKTITVTTAGETVKVMPDGALYWYGNECTDITGGWSIHNVEHHTYNGSAYSVLTAPLMKNKNSMYVGWDSEDLAQVPTTYYYSSSLSTNNAVSYTHSTAKVKIKHSEAVKEVSDSRYGVLGGCGYNTANSGNTYWNINWGVSLDYPNNTAGENVLTNQYLSGSNSSTNVYFSVFVSVFKNSPARQYQNIEIEYFVLE